MKTGEIHCFKAYDTAKGEWVQQYDNGTPKEWFDNVDIDQSTIYASETIPIEKYEWKKINSYLRYDVGWSTTKINELRKAYPTFKDYLFARDESALVDLLNHAEANFPGFGTQEADHIRDLLGIN